MGIVGEFFTVNVYQWKADVECRWLTTSSTQELDRFVFEGDSRMKGWIAPQMAWILDEQGDAKRAITDCPNFVSGVPVLSARAVAALGPLLADVGELLSLDFAPHSYYAVNVTRVIDALDEQQSEVVRFPSSGRIMTVNSFAFRRPAVANQAVFKEFRLARSSVFVLDAFVEAVTQARLTGFVFTRIWSDRD